MLKAVLLPIQTLFIHRFQTIEFCFNQTILLVSKRTEANSPIVTKNSQVWFSPTSYLVIPPH